MTAPDPRLHERLHRAADPLPVDVEARLEASRRRAHVRQVRRRVGAGVVATAIGLAAAVAVWSLRSDTEPQPAAPAGLTGTLLYSPASNMNADDPQLRALNFDEGGADTAQEEVWPGPGPSFAADGSTVAYLVETGREREGLRLYDIAVRPLPDGPETIVLRDVATMGAPILGRDGQIAYLEYDVQGGVTTHLRIARTDGTVVRTVLEGNVLTGFAWSPDGSTFAVSGRAVLAEGLTLMDATGRHLREVALPPGSSVEGMSWSADGSMLAFTATSVAPDEVSRLWVVRSDGTGLRSFPAEATYEGSSVWSPDGRWIAFTSDRLATPEQRAANATGQTAEGFDLFVMRRDGTDVHRLVENDGIGWTTPVAWLPSVREVDPSPPVAAEPAGFFLWARKGVAGPEGTGLPHVYVQPFDGSAGRVEVEDPPVFVSPDGSKILWEEYLGDRMSDVVVGNPDRSSPVVVATLEFTAVRWLEWSHDGTRIAYTYGGDDGTELWVVDVATGEGSLVSRMVGMFGVSWSPDDARLVVGVEAVEGPTEPGVYTMSPDGTATEQISSREAVDVAWSPAGDAIVFGARAPGAQTGAGLWSVAPDGSGERYLLPGASYPLWSPDGRWLLYTAADPDSNDEQPAALWVARPDGSDARKVVPDPGEGWPIPWAWVDRWPL